MPSPSGGGAGVEADERTAADGDIRTALRIRIIDAVEQILAAAFPLLVQIEGAALDGQGAFLHLNHANVTVEGAVFDGQVALHHVDGVAIVLLGIYGAVTSDGHLGAIRDGQDGDGIIAPDVLRVLDGLVVQIQRMLLLMASWVFCSTSVSSVTVSPSWAASIAACKLAKAFVPTCATACETV